MTIAEAEEYYKRYLGHGFHMCREEPGRYEYFKRLNLPEEVLAQWDADLLERELEQMLTDGGVYRICVKTKQGERMKRIMEERFLPGPAGDVRHAEAVRRYREALRRFGRK